MMMATTEVQAQEKTLPQFDVTTFESQVAWLALTFIILYIVISRIALPKVDEVLEERGENIDGNLDKAETMRAESEEIKASYEASLADARAKAQKASFDVKEAIRADVSKATKDLEQKLSQQADEAAIRIAAAKSKVMAELDTVAIEVASELVGKLSGQEVDQDRVKTAVDEKLTLVKQGV